MKLIHTYPNKTLANHLDQAQGKGRLATVLDYDKGTTITRALIVGQRRTMHGSPLVEIKNAGISGLSFEKMGAQRKNRRALTLVCLQQ